MSELEKRDAVETEFVDAEKKEGTDQTSQTTEAKEPPKSEEKKPNPIIRGFKACGHGIASAGRATASFIRKHPYVAAGMSAVAGYGLKWGLDILLDSKGEAPAAEPVSLPEPEPVPVMPEPVFEPEPEPEPTVTFSVPDDTPEPAPEPIEPGVSVEE